jgi:hypothetical protein
MGTEAGDVGSSGGKPVRVGFLKVTLIVSRASRPRTDSSHRQQLEWIAAAAITCWHSS